MKLLRFGLPGKEKPGLLDASGTLRDLSGVVNDIAGSVLLPDGLSKLARLDPASLPAVSDASRIGACVAAVGKLIGVGLNYADHARETGAEIPEEPILFAKATSAIIGPDDDVVLPPGSEKTDWEVELGVVIGRPARDVPVAQALEHVAGYCIVNDVSERDFQFGPGGQWFRAKSCDTFAPVGPWLVTPDKVPDPQALHLYLDVNGRRFQDGSTATMIFTVAELISYISQWMTLQTGDIIATGTPPGVGLGQSPPVFLRTGDVMELGIDGLGRQRQKVVAAGA